MKTLTGVIALMLALMFGVSNLVVAGDAPAAPAAAGDAPAAPTAEEALIIAKACEGKKAGETVQVDGKDVKCPAPKK